MRGADQYVRTARTSASHSARTTPPRPTRPGRRGPHRPTRPAPGWPPVAPDSPRIVPRSSKRTPTEVTPRRPIPDLPIIGLTALLRLVEWIEERRITSQQGGPPCVDLRANVSPPAADRVQGATTTGPALAGSDRRP